jgi:hypothetical protein
MRYEKFIVKKLFNFLVTLFGITILAFIFFIMRLDQYLGQFFSMLD